MFIVNAADSSLLLGFDFLIFLLTIVKTISVVMESRRLKMEKGLSYYLLRDGENLKQPSLLFRLKVDSK